MKGDKFILLGICSWPQLTEADKAKIDPFGKSGKASLQVICPSEDHPAYTPQMADLWANGTAIVKDLAKSQFRPKDELRLPFRSGDEKDGEGNFKNQHEVYRGSEFVRANTKFDVEVLAGRDKTPFPVDQVTAGDLIAVEVTPSTFDEPGNKGVKLYLGTILVIRQAAVEGLLSSSGEFDDGVFDPDAIEFGEFDAPEDAFDKADLPF